MKITHGIARIVVATGLVIQSAGWLLAQQPPMPRFEIASVKPNNSGGSSTNLGLAGGRFSATNAPLRELIRMAYELPDQLIVNAPEWTRNERFDVIATMPHANVPVKEVFAMVQALLAERFKLAAHEETREIKVYALRLANANGTLGPRLQRSMTDCDTIMSAARNGTPPPASNRILCGNRWRGGHVEVGGSTMDAIATMLWPIVSDVVVNQTALQGRFDFEMDFAPDVSLNAAVTPSGDAPSIFTALQEQLGLKLESQREPRDVLVIDHIERPTPD